MACYASKKEEGSERKKVAVLNGSVNEEAREVGREPERLTHTRAKVQSPFSLCYKGKPKDLARHERVSSLSLNEQKGSKA